RVGLAHANREEALAGGDPGQDLAFRPLAAVAQDLVAALAVRDPVRADRRAAREHFLGDHVALERRALMSAEPFRPAHADVAAGAALAAERRIEAVPR